MSAPQPNFGILIGSKLIKDIFYPKPDEIDIEGIEQRLKNTRRFSNHPKALTVWQHKEVVKHLVNIDRSRLLQAEGYTTKLVDTIHEWADYHDDHEGVIGDIVAPIKRAVSSRTNILEIIEVRLDKAICHARGVQYPSSFIREKVYHYDKCAETLEWVYALGEPLGEFNYKTPDLFMELGQGIIDWARSW